MFERLDQLIVWLSDRIPLELFTFIGSFLEDVLAPIPSPLVTTTAGTIAFAQGYLFIGLFWLALIAAAGKTLGCIVIYIITDKAEDFFMTRLGPRLGVTHKEIENLGKYFKGTWRDYLTLTVIRALPIIPSLPVSAVAGVIKIPMRLYIITSMVGTFFRSILFLIFGYTGLSAYRTVLEGMGSIESLIQILIVLALGGAIVWMYYRRAKKRSGAHL